MTGKPRADSSGAEPDPAVAGSSLAWVSATFGRHAYLVADDGRARTAVMRGRRHDVVVGDRVSFTELGSDQAVIERVLERRNLIRRCDDNRQKALAANVDQVALVVGGDPPYDEELLLRVMVAAEAEGVESLVVATKSDLPDATARIEPRLALYQRLGYPVLRVSARRSPQATIAALAPRLRSRVTLLMGESGMGKSTLVNTLVPQADLR
ncbi:MAG TPA: GTPase RsgA, partial [Burkholderiaceae bacterium]|nr:GTPase RsgA [Burkholderiaceae bacterium]